MPGSRIGLRGYLFDGHEVEVDRHSAGQSWVLRDGALYAMDALLIKFFFEQMQRFDEPVVLDVGASTGPFSLLAKFHPGVTVYAFEPDIWAYGVLVENVKLNDLSGRVHTWQRALMEEEGEGVLKLPIGRAPGLATLGVPRRFDEWNELEVEVLTIDGLALERLDLVKIDVEGAELFVLKGGERTIRRCMPGILLEYVNTYQFDYDYDELLAPLREWGYTRFEKIQRDAAYGYTDLWATCK